MQYKSIAFVYFNKLRIRYNKSLKNSSPRVSWCLYLRRSEVIKQPIVLGRILFSPIKGVSNIKDSCVTLCLKRTLWCFDFLNNFHFPVEVLCSSKVPSMPILTRNLFLRLFSISSHHTIPLYFVMDNVL